MDQLETTYNDSSTNYKNLLLRIGQHWALLFLLFEIICFSYLAPAFFSLASLQIILLFGSTVFLLATAETFVIVTGGIDLSVGFVMGFASIVCSKLIVVLVNSGLSPGLSIAVGIILTLLIGLIPGLINGLLVGQLNVPPFIATFSMLGITHGISELLIKGVPAKNLPQLASSIGNGSFFYIVPGKTFSFFQKPVIERGEQLIEIIPNIVVITFIFVAIFAFILKRTPFGQHVYATGGNINAAIRAGINVKWVFIKVYMLSSFFASLAGILYMLQYVTGKADAGASFLLDSIVAVVIGGASLYGGVGTIWKTILGGLIIAVLEAGLRLMGVPTFDKYIFVGIILVFAVLVDRLFQDN